MQTQGPIEEFCVRPDGSFHIEFRVSEIADEVRGLLVNKTRRVAHQRSAQACRQFHGYNIAGRNMTAVQCSTIIWSPLDDIKKDYQGHP
jgi:hypothetical protein